ncbi:hypothetical protein GO988_23005 [Hymenobacter sp. HMF4947]|uniref:Uncharacterized protein n=1 Tax=Hymenobacter ginkgonis TaxID=2682976 RepID=A0A7K1TM59_9BACT|nr:hypothetical protein [Hymenobacter ginkgonis]MVN79211.1 hypothetical protein [Hymenobacter ginkgonis]
MELISRILDDSNVTIEALIHCFELVKQNGDVAVIKFDGERTLEPYTIFITFPLAKQRGMIRVEENDLKTGLLKALTEYIKE